MSQKQKNSNMNQGEEKENKTILLEKNNEEIEDEEEKEKNKSEFRNKEKFVLIERKTEKKQNELLINYDLTNLAKLDIKTEEEKSEITKLINNILLSSNFSFMIYALSKIFGYLKSLVGYNLFYFIGIKLIYKLLNSKKEDSIVPKASIWKRLLLFNLPELIIIFYYRKKRLSKVNTAIYTLFTYLNERICYVFNINEKNNFLCQVDQKDYNILLFEKGNIKSEDILYMNRPEILAQETFFDSVIAYPNANFEDFDFNNLTQEEENMYQDIFTFINEVEKKVKDEYRLYNNLGSICSNLSFNNSSNYKIVNALVLKLVSFLILEIYLSFFKKRKRRNTLFEEKEKEFNEKCMKNGYYLAVNEYVILLFKIKDEYKNFDESYNELHSKCRKLLKGYFAPVNSIF